MMKIIRIIVSIGLFVISLSILLPLLVLTVPFWIYKGVYVLTYSLFKPNTVSWSEILQYDAELGWKPKPNLNAIYVDVSGDECSLVTDDSGWVGKTSMNESDIMVIGDSFAMGYGSYFKKSFIEQTRKAKIKAFAAPGYNMVQQFLLLKKYGHQFRGKRVAWFICFENDLYDNIFPHHHRHYKNPCIVYDRNRDEWKIMTEHIKQNQENVFSNTRKYQKFYAKISIKNDFSDKIYSGARYVINEAKQIADEFDLELYILGIPFVSQLSEKMSQKDFQSKLSDGEQFNTNYMHDQFSEICEENNINFIQLRRHLTTSDYKLYDTHWNTMGNRKVAHILDDIYLNKFK